MFSIYDELNGAPLLVAYQFQHDLARILKKFPNAVALAKGVKGNRQIEAWNYEHYAQIIERIGPIRQHQAGHPRPVFVYQIQAEGTLDQVVQARVEGKADVQDLLMEYCKMKKPL